MAWWLPRVKPSSDGSALVPTLPLKPLQYESAPSSYVVACVPAVGDAAYLFQDVSGKNNHLIPDPLNTGAFATAGAISTIAATPGGVVLPAGRCPLNFSRDSFLISIDCNQATPGGAKTLYSVMAKGTAGWYGFYLSLRTNGSLKCIPMINGAAFAGGNDGTVTVGDSTLHNIVFAWDAPSRTIYLYKDGKLMKSDLQWKPVSSFPDQTFSDDIRIGGFVGSNATTAFATTHFQMYKFAGNGLPLNIGEIAVRLHRDPKKPVVDNDFAFPAKRVLIGFVGQSNEMGPGPATIIKTTGYRGGPYYETSNGMWADTCSEFGRRGVWLQPMNKAVGSTSLATSWNGCVRNWVTGMTVSTGSFVLNGGSLFRASVSGGSSLPNGGTNATATSTNAPTDGGKDAAITWTLTTATPSALLVDGYVFKHDDGTGYFDTNGLIAAATTNAAIATNPGFDKYVFAIQIGQSDAKIGTTRDMYRDAMIATARYLRTLGFTVLLGMTFRSRNTGDEARYNDHLIPGRDDAIAYFAGGTGADSGVVAGPDLTTLGILPTETSPAMTSPGLQDQSPSFVHGNGPAMTAAAGVWGAWLDSNASVLL